MAEITQDERRDRAFRVSLGEYISRFKKINKDGSAIIDFDLDLNTDLLEDFFRLGWIWGRLEHHDPCPECPQPPICPGCGISHYTYVSN